MKLFNTGKESLVENTEPFRTLDDVPLRRKVLAYITMPIEMIRLKVRKNGIIRRELFQWMSHETWDFNNDNTFFLFFLNYFSNSRWKWNIEISRKIHWFFERIFLIEYTIGDPCSRRLSVCTGYRDSGESLWEVSIGEIQLRENLPTLIDGMCSRDSWRRNNSHIRIKRTRRVIVIVDFIGEREEVTEWSNGIPNFPLSVDKIHIEKYIFSK